MGGFEDSNPTLPLFLLNETLVMDGCRVNILGAYSKGKHMDTAIAILHWQGSESTDNTSRVGRPYLSAYTCAHESKGAENEHWAVYWTTGEFI